jgi:hypothetical protein
MKNQNTPRKLAFGSITLTALLGLTAWFALAFSAAASPPAVAMGNFWFTSEDITVIRVDGTSGNLYFTFVLEGYYTGDLTGYEAATGQGVLYRNGSLSYQGNSVVTSATIGGRSGSFTHGFEGSISATGAEVGREFAVQGFGGLEGLHYEGTYGEPDPATPQSYIFQYQFAP